MAKVGRKKKETHKIIRLAEGLDNEIVAMSRNFATAYTFESNLHLWGELQQKLFFLLLNEIDWTRGGNSNIIELNNREAQEKLGWGLSKSDQRKMGKTIREQINDMAQNDWVSLQDPITGEWASEHLLQKAYGNSTYTTVVLNPIFMNHFQRLYEAVKTNKLNFISFSGYDIWEQDSSYGVRLFVDLCNCSKHDGSINHRTHTTKRLKELFGLSIDAYMRDYDEKTGTYKNFNRSTFERRVLDSAIESINKSEAVEILPWEDGKYYQKEKDESGKVTGYTFKYRVYDLERIRQKRLDNEGKNSIE